MRLCPTAANRVIGLHPGVRWIVTSLQDTTTFALNVENIAVVPAALVQRKLSML